MNLNNDNNGYESNDNDDLFGDLPPMTDEQMAELKEIVEEPFTHPNSPYRSDLIPSDVRSVATSFMMANTWTTTNWLCFVAVMKEMNKDLPPYLARRVTLAMKKMNDIILQSGDRHVVISKAVLKS